MEDYINRQLRYVILFLALFTVNSNSYGQDVAFNNADATMIQITKENPMENAQFNPADGFCAAFSQDSKMLAYVNYDNDFNRNAFLTILELSPRKILHKTAIPWMPQIIAWSPKGDKIMMCLSGKLIHYDIASGRIVSLPVSVGYIVGIHWKKENEVYLDVSGIGIDILKLDDLTYSTIEFGRSSEASKYELENPLSHPKCRILSFGSVIKVVNLDNSYSHLLRSFPFNISYVASSDNLKYIVCCYFKSIFFMELGVRPKPETHFSVQLKNYDQLGTYVRKNLSQFTGNISGAKLNPLNNICVGGDGNTRGTARMIGFVNDSVVNIEVIDELATIRKGDVFTYNDKFWGKLENAKASSVNFKDSNITEASDTKLKTTNEQAKENIRGSLAIDKTIIDNLDGNWAGEISQKKKSYAVRLSCKSPTKEFTINYPSLHCSGYWEIETSADTSIDFREHILTGKLLCGDGGLIRLLLISRNQVEYSYLINSRTVAKGILTKE